jgi:hypothetical protein
MQNVRLAEDASSTRDPAKVGGGAPSVGGCADTSAAASKKIRTEMELRRKFFSPEDCN